jgi:hypothetical protein
MLRWALAKQSLLARGFPGQVEPCKLAECDTPTRMLCPRNLLVTAVTEQKAVGVISWLSTQAPWLQTRSLDISVARESTQSNNGGEPFRSRSCQAKPDRPIFSPSTSSSPCDVSISMTVANNVELELL